MCTCLIGTCYSYHVPFADSVPKEHFERVLVEPSTHTDPARFTVFHKTFLAMSHTLLACQQARVYLGPKALMITRAGYIYVESKALMTKIVEQPGQVNLYDGRKDNSVFLYSQCQ